MIVFFFLSFFFFFLLLHSNIPTSNLPLCPPIIK